MLMQQSPKEFHDHPGEYLHCARQRMFLTDIRPEYVWQDQRMKEKGTATRALDVVLGIQ